MVFIRYKPSIHGTIGIYYKNEYGLRPSIYSSRWDRRLQQWSVWSFKNNSKAWEYDSKSMAVASQKNTESAKYLQKVEADFLKLSLK